MPQMGVSYQPGAMQDYPMNGQGGAASALAPQGPAQILGLRLPRNLGQSPVAARELLTAPGAGGAPDLNAIIQALMRTSMQPPMTAQGQMAPPRSNGSSDVSRQDNAMTGRMSPFSGGTLSPLAGAGMAFPGGSGATPAPRITIRDGEYRPDQPALGSEAVPLPLDTPHLPSPQDPSGFSDAWGPGGLLPRGSGAPTSSPVEASAGMRNPLYDLKFGDMGPLF